MRHAELLLILVVLTVTVGSAVAAPSPELAATPPARESLPARLASPPPSVRQGGDTILDATPLTLPVIDQTGTTSGYTNDYDEICPYSGSTAPDVVYTFTLAQSTSVDIDMVGSQYDTKIYVYDQDLMVVACNDDFYSDWTSKLENLYLIGGAQYYLVIDGYGSASGPYCLNLTEYVPCELEYHSGAADEMEPPLADGYEDAWNGGCNSPEYGYPFQPISSLVFMGRAGWFLNASGGTARDTDWFQLIIPSGGVLEITGDAEHETYMFELGPHDCGSVGVVQNVPIGPCQAATMTIAGPSGSTVWFWVGSQTFQPPDGFVGYEYYYILMTNQAMPVETRSFSEVKALFR